MQITTLNRKKINSFIFSRIIVVIAVQLFLMSYSTLYPTRLELPFITIINLFAVISCSFMFKVAQKDFKSLVLNIFLVLFDTVYLIVLITLTGGINSPFMLLLPLYIFLTSSTFKTTGTIFSTILSVVIVVSSYLLTEDRTYSITFVITFSAILVLFALVTKYFIQEGIKSKTSITALDKLNKILIESMKMGIINLNNYGLILSTNKTVEKMFGDKENIIKKVKELIQAGSTEPHKFKLDSETYFSVHKINTQDGSSLVLRDISRDTEKEKKDEEFKKLKLINTIASVLAHEIKNPVSSLMGVSQLVNSDPEILNDPTQKEKLFKIINRETRRLTNLAEEFLIYSGPEKRRDEEINLTVLVQNSYDGIRANKDFIDKKIKLEFISDNKSYIIYGDFQRILQAIDNLLINAVHASPEDKKITCSLERINDTIILTIADEGEGISEEIKNKIFEPFFTTKDKGTGLGLAIAKNIILAHGGSIEVLDNKPGTLFKIEFPNIKTTGVS